MGATDRRVGVRKASRFAFPSEKRANRDGLHTRKQRPALLPNESRAKLDASLTPTRRSILPTC